MRFSKRRVLALHSLGFTTLELVLVIMILGIISAISVPRIASIVSDVEVKGAAERILDDLNFARNYAITHKDTTWFVGNVASNQYGIYAGPDPGSRTLIEDPYTGESAVVDFDTEYDAVSFSTINFGGSDEVSFDWRGSPSSGGIIVFNSRTITLVPGTGVAYE